MTMALDPNVPELVDQMKNIVPDYLQHLDELQTMLEHKLRTENLTLVELYHKIAMR